MDVHHSTWSPPVLPTRRPLCLLVPITNIYRRQGVDGRGHDSLAAAPLTPSSPPHIRFRRTDFVSSQQIVGGKWGVYWMALGVRNSHWPARLAHISLCSFYPESAWHFHTSLRHRYITREGLPCSAFFMWRACVTKGSLPMTSGASPPEPNGKIPGQHFLKRKGRKEK